MTDAHPELEHQNERAWQRFGFQILLLGGVLFVVVVTATGMGYIELGFADVLRVLVAKLTSSADLADRIDPLWPVVVFEVRLPRILTAAIVGAGLSVSGVVFQGILLNPLAEPYTLGISAGAAFGASVALLLGVTWAGVWSVSLFAFAGAVLTLLAVIYLAMGSDQLSSHNLILSGIIVAAILSAGVSFIKYLADEQVAIIIFWLMGSFASKTWGDVLITAIVVTGGSLVFVYYGRELNLIALGKRSATSLGVDMIRVPMILLVSASLVAAVCVAVSGIIGFVGLLVPHMMRRISGPDHRLLIPVSILAGAILLLVADTVTRAVLPREIPIGVITALIGGPFFCYIYRKRQKTERF